MNLLLLAGLTSLSGPALASVPDLVGMGPKNISMGSASTALANDAYAPYYNPAGIAQMRRITMAAAPVLGQATLSPFSGIVYDTNGDGLLTDGLGVPEYGPVGTDYRIPTGDGGVVPFYTNGIEFGLVLPLFHVVAIGITGYLPSDALLRVSVADPTIPYYVMFADRNNRFAVNPALAIHPFQGVYLGLGAQVMAGIQADAGLSTHVEVSAFSADGEAQSVEANVQADIDQLDVLITPDVRLNLGFLVDASILSKSRDPEKVSRLSRHAIGGSFRGKWLASTNVAANVSVTGQIQLEDETLLLSELVKEPISLEIEGLNAFYNPPQGSLGIRTGIGDVRDALGRLEDTPRLLVTADATWTQWSSFQETTSPAMELTVDSLEGIEMVIKVGQDYGTPNFKDTISYRGGLQLSSGPFLKKEAIEDMQVRIRAGGQWVPTPVPLQTGKTNYMDNDRIVGTAGLGFEIGRLDPFPNLPPITKGPVSLDLGGQFHYLVPRAQQKNADLIQDSDGDGVPEYIQGYPMGGQISSSGMYWVATAGVSFQVGDPQEHPRPLRSIKDGPVGFPTPAAPLDEAAPTEGGEGTGEVVDPLAIPVDGEGAPETTVPEETSSRKARRAERKARKAGLEPVEGVEAPADGVEAPADGVEAPAEGVEGLESAVPSVDGVEGAPTDAEATKKGKRDKKPKKEKKGKKDAAPEGEEIAPEGADPELSENPEDLDASLEEPEPGKKAKKEKKEKKEKKPKKGKKGADAESSEEGASDEPLPETEDAPTDSPDPDKQPIRFDADEDAGETP